MFKLNPIFYFVLVSFLSTNIYAENNESNNLIIEKDSKHDLSLPLRDLQASSDIVKHKYSAPIQKIILDKTAKFSELPNTATLIPLTAFQGIGVGLGSYNVTQPQPDLNGGTGMVQYFQYANPDIAIFTKAGQLLPGFPKPAQSLWAGFGGSCENFAKGRITIKYDQIARRWIVSQLAYQNQETGPFFYCVGVSTSDDATGTYNRYTYQLDSYSSYAELALWPDAFYLGLNMVGRISYGPRICALDRNKMLNGQPANIICKQLNHDESQPLMPANVLGQSLLPPAKTPGYFLAVNTVNSVTIYKFYTDFVNPNNTIISTIKVPVSPYKQACQDTNGVACAIQPDTNTRLDLLSDRFLTRVVYRQLPGGFGSLAAAHVIEGPQPKFAPAVRWYEFRVYDSTTTRNPIVHQQATIAPDSKNRFAPSINVDTFGNIAVAYNVSSSKIHPSPELAWRSFADPLNTMTIQPLVTGFGSQIGITAWSRVTKLVTDPINRCTMYYSGEYLKTTGSMNWSTAVVKFNLPGCV